MKLVKSTLRMNYYIIFFYEIKLYILEIYVLDYIIYL